MRTIIGFSFGVAVSLAEEGDVFVCRRCRLSKDGATDTWLGDDPNGVEHHLHEHVAAKHDGAELALEKFVEHYVALTTTKVAK